MMIKILSVLFVFFMSVSPMAWAETPLPNSAETSLSKLDIWTDIDTEWGRVVRQYDVPVDIVEQDVTCDGEKDIIASRINLDNPDTGPTFDFILLTMDGGMRHRESISIPFTGSSEQFGLCMDPAKGPKAELFFDAWPKEDIDEFIGMNVCSTPIEIVDNMCDTPAFFWDKDAKKDEPNLVFFRH